jgi:UDP-3-O-[3-hydroxymyristoyl] glucosamine N-acyltransferase
MIDDSKRRNDAAQGETTAGKLAAFVQGELKDGGDETVIGGFASLKDARAGDLSFFSDERYREQFINTKASAVLVPMDMQGHCSHTVCITVKAPTRAFDSLVEKYGYVPPPFCAGIHPAAVIAATAKFDPARVAIGPCAVIEDGAEIGDGVRIGPGCCVGRNVRIGNESTLFANVSVHADCVLGERVILHSGVVIGGDGFGYAFENGRHRKIGQTGIVQIDNDVEIGANSTVDRARFGRTWIGEGTKIDNLVQIGHNAVIGKHCILVAFAAIAGSAEIGDYVVVAGQAAVAGHVSVGARATLGARSGVTKDLAAGESYLGFPAVNSAKERRRIASVALRSHQGSCRRRILPRLPGRELREGTASHRLRGATPPTRAAREGTRTAAPRERRRSERRGLSPPAAGKPSLDPVLLQEHSARKSALFSCRPNRFLIKMPEVISGA